MICLNRGLLLLSLLLSCSLLSTAQSAHKYMKEAEAHLLQHDTDAAVSSMEQLLASYPESPAVILTNQCLADIYSARGYKDSAKERLIYALSYVPFAEAWEPKPDTFAAQYYLFTAKADVAVRLSRLYDNAGDTAKGLYFLNLADSLFLPVTDSMLLQLDYRSYLSLRYREHYLRFGDTAAARSRLLSFFMVGTPRSDELTDSLRSLLLARYSSRTIKRFVDRAIATVKTDTVAENGKNVVYYSCLLFDTTIIRAEFRSRKSFQSMLRRNRYIRRLKG